MGNCAGVCMRVYMPTYVHDCLFAYMHMCMDMFNLGEGFFFFPFLRLCSYIGFFSPLHCVCVRVCAHAFVYVCTLLGDLGV